MKPGFLLRSTQVLHWLIAVVCLCCMASPGSAWATPPQADTDEDRGSDTEEGGNDSEEEAEEEVDFLLNEVVGAAAIYPQDAAEIQLTLTAAYQDRRTDHLGAFNYLVEVGVTDWWQFEVGWTGPLFRGGRGNPTTLGVGDLEVGTQFTWMHIGGSSFSAAAAFEIGIPLQLEETAFSEGILEYEPFVTLAYDAPGGWLHVFTNVGFDLSAKDSQPFVNVGVIAAVSIARPYLVASYTSEEQYLIAGASLILPEGWEVIVGVPVGLSETSSPIGCSLILIYEFNPLDSEG